MIRLDTVFDKKVHTGVIVTAVIGGISTVLLLLLLVHIISVTFFPFLPIGFIKRQIPLRRALSNSTSFNTGSYGTQNRSNKDLLSDLNNLDLERKETLAERQARARSRDAIQQKALHKRERASLRLQLGIFIVCMLISDLIQSIGAVMQTRWVLISGIENGRLCWVQAFMITFGDVATAVWNAIIAIHTFYTIVLTRRMSNILVGVLVCVGWFIPTFLILIGDYVIARPQRGNYWGLAGAWCFISAEYRLERVTLHYLPMLFSAIIITVAYSLVFLTIRGYLVVGAGVRSGCLTPFTLSFRRRAPLRVENPNQRQNQYLRALALKMLWYPMAYLCLVLPIAVSRIAELKKTTTSLPVQLGLLCLLFLVGISNVIIYLATRNLNGPKREKIVNTPGASQQVEVFMDRVTQRDGVTLASRRTQEESKPFDRYSKYSPDDEYDYPVAKYDSNPYMAQSNISRPIAAMVYPQTYTNDYTPQGGVTVERVGTGTFNERDSDQPFRGYIVDAQQNPAGRTMQRTSSLSGGNNYRYDTQRR